DLTVTGVQTCALPIYLGIKYLTDNCKKLTNLGLAFTGSTRSRGPRSYIDDGAACYIASECDRLQTVELTGTDISDLGLMCLAERSEERRVGKECRCRW